MTIAPRQTPIITDSNIDEVEAGIAVWDDSADYVFGNEVQLNAPTHRKYKCIKDNTNQNPLNNSEYWLNMEATLYYKAFDELASSKCINDSQIYYKFTTSDIDLLMFEGVKAQTVRIKITNNENSEIMLDETSDLINRNVYDWFDWQYMQAEKISSFFKKLPMALNTSMEIWLDSSNDVEIGHMVFGRSRNYGMTLAEPSPVTSRRSLTSKERDEWGNIITRRKARFKRMTINILIDSSAIDLIENRLEEIVDTPCIFVGDESEGGYRSLLIYGELRDHDMPIGSTKTQYQLDVEGYI